MPALAIATSMPSKRSTVACTAASSAPRSVTSASKNAARSPSAAAFASRRSGSSPTRATLAPRACKRRAASAPMPRAAPVMNTVRPAISYVVFEERLTRIASRSSVLAARPHGDACWAAYPGRVAAMAALDPSSSALELAAALRARELSAVELLDVCLAAVDERDAQTNAIVWRNDEDARAAAEEADRRLADGEHSGEQGESPFLGVPIPVKDLTPVAGWPVTYGSNGAPEGVSDTSELVVDALVRAGFVLCARTNTPEFGVITAAENTRYGVSRNPWDLDRTPGGSSGGAAAAVAGGMFPIAHANDGGGSIRIPASYCGLVGLKPSRGRVPRLAQSWLGAVVEGVVSRTVGDAAVVLDAIVYQHADAWYYAPAPARPFAEQTGTPPGALRVGLMAQAPLGMPTDPECVAGARAVAATLEELGHSVEEVEVPTISEEMIPPFILLTLGGLADYAGVD